MFKLYLENSKITNNKLKDIKHTDEHNTHNKHNTHTTNMLYVVFQRTSKTMAPYMRHVFMTPFRYIFLFY